MLEPECDVYVHIVHKLSSGDLTKQEAIWQMKEEEVMMAMYLRYVDSLNEAYAAISS